MLTCNGKAKPATWIATVRTIVRIARSNKPSIGIGIRSIGRVWVDTIPSLPVPTISVAWTTRRLDVDVLAVSILGKELRLPRDLRLLHGLSHFHMCFVVLSFFFCALGALLNSFFVRFPRDLVLEFLSKALFLSGVF